MKNHNESSEKMGMIHRVLDELREQHINDADFYKSINADSQNWNNWKNRGLPHAMAATVADKLNLTCDYLISGHLPKYKHSGVSDKPNTYNAIKSHPYYPRVVGTAQCGENGYYIDLEGGDGYVEFEAAKGSIAIKIKGHSMHPAIREGWFVVIEPNRTPDIGEYVLVKFKDGKKMVKELLQIKSDSYILLSVNTNDRITAQFDEIDGDIQPISAIVPPSKHKQF